jgi:hypothetical protein
MTLRSPKRTNHEVKHGSVELTCSAENCFVLFRIFAKMIAVLNDKRLYFEIEEIWWGTKKWEAGGACNFNRRTEK